MVDDWSTLVATRSDSECFTRLHSPTFAELVSVLRSIPLPYAAIVPPLRPRKLAPIDLPDSMACSARYRLIDSGMSLQSSPFSILFFAMFFILARLEKHQSLAQQLSLSDHTCSGTKSARTAQSC